MAEIEQAAETRRVDNLPVGGLGPLNAEGVFLQDKLQFLEQKGSNLSGSPSQHFLSRHGKQLTFMVNWTSQSGFLKAPSLGSLRTYSLTLRPTLADLNEESTFL